MGDAQPTPSPLQGEGRGEGATPSPPKGASRGSGRSRDPKTIASLFGFDLDDDSWLAQVRDQTSLPSAGRIGPYELLEIIGRGEQGVVFKARQPRTDRLIAIKRLSAGAFATPEMRARFEREVEAAVALDHPNIVTVFGTEVVDGQPLLAMKWIDGVPIDRWARPPHEPPRPVREIIELFTIVCDAVHHAHQRGVIHRDLKPSNILVDKENRPLVLDFGLAKVARESAPAASITMTGEFLGTPAFAAPEQIRGDVRAVDVRTDVYALGAILYRLLTGILPIADTGDLPALMQNVLHREPPRPSSHDSDLNREIDVILLKALAKDKDQRYASVDALADDLRRFLTGQAVLAHPPSTVYQVRKFVRQHRAGVSAAAVILFLLLGSSVVSTVLFVRGDRQRRLAELESRKAKEASGFVTSILSSANRRTQQGNANVTVREVLDRSAADLDGGRVTYEPEVEAVIRKTIADTYKELGLGQVAEPHYLRAIELLRSFGRVDADFTMAECMERLGSVYRWMGRIDEAERMIEGALRATRARLGPKGDDLYTASALVSLGVLKRGQGKFAEAEALYLHAMSLYSKFLGPDDSNVGMTRMNLGWVYMHWGRLEDAETWMRDAMDLFQRIHDERDFADAQWRLGAIHFARADPTGDAESLLREGLATSVRIMGADHPVIAQPTRYLADYLAAAGHVEEAIELYARAISMAASAQQLDFVGAYVDLVRDHPEALGRAEKVLRAAIEKHESSLGPTHAVIAGLLHHLETILTEKARLEPAE